LFSAFAKAVPALLAYTPIYHALPESLQGTVAERGRQAVKEMTDAAGEYASFLSPLAVLFSLVL
jgi:hypothetical protein